MVYYVNGYDIVLLSNRSFSLTIKTNRINSHMVFLIRCPNGSHDVNILKANKKLVHLNNWQQLLVTFVVIKYSASINLKIEKGHLIYRIKAHTDLQT